MEERFWIFVVSDSDFLRGELELELELELKEGRESMALLAVYLGI
jgi:hypothetical protein